MKNIKKICFGFMALVVVIYFCFCIIVHLSYKSNLNNLVSNENTIYTSNLGTATDDIIVIEKVDKNEIIFRKVGNLDVAPFNLAKIPIVKSEYTFFVSNPSASTYSEKRTRMEIGDRINEDIFIVKDFFINEVNDKNFGFHYCYFGYCTDASQLNDVKQFCLKYNLDKGFVFMFISYENPDFDDTTLKTLSISLDN